MAPVQMISCYFSLFPQCGEKKIRFYYSGRSHSCQSFVFNGCGGNANNFLNYKTCKTKCQPRMLIAQPSRDFLLAIRVLNSSQLISSLGCL